MPVSTTDPMISVLPPLPNDILVDFTNKRLGLLTQDQDSVFTLNSNVDFSRSRIQVCLWSLVFGSTEQPAQACDFSVIRRGASPLYQNLLTNMYIVNSLPLTSLICENTTRFLNTCTPCVIEIKCSCALKSGDMVLVESPNQ